MPYESSPSPVAPISTSRLWTVGISIAIALVVLVGLAFVHPQIANWLIGGAVVVAFSAWILNAQPSSAAPLPESIGAPVERPSDPMTAELLDRVF